MDVNDGLQEKQLSFLTISSSSNGTSVYFEGTLKKFFPHFQISYKDIAGQIVLGSSTVQPDTWPGEVHGLALYSRELRPQEVSQSYREWIGGQRGTALVSNDTIPRYVFHERAGNIVHDLGTGHKDLTRFDHLRTFFGFFAILFLVKFRAPDMVGRFPVRFLLQESTGFSIPTDSKSGQVKVRTPVKEKPSQLRLPGRRRRGVERFQSRKCSSQNRVISILGFRKSGQFKVRTQGSKKLCRLHSRRAQQKKMLGTCSLGSRRIGNPEIYDSRLKKRTG